MKIFLKKILSDLGRSGRERRIREKLADFKQPYKLHLGCGKIRFEGWINLDSDKLLDTADVYCDLSQGIPIEDGSCALIYCEHFLEHLSVEEGLSLLRECHRVLRSGGVLRIAMPSLENVIKKYASDDWKDQDWLTWPEHQFIQTRAEMINISFRWWGHKWLYDREELSRRLAEAGFQKIKDVQWGVSQIEELNNRETRKDSLLICEVTK